jgi:hypothetical protein
MSTSKLRIAGAALALATSALTGSGCLAGPAGNPTPIASERQPAPSDRDSVGSSREDPGGSRDNPGGESSGGSSPGGSTCIECDKTYRCTVSSNGETATIGLRLRTNDAGVCVTGTGNDESSLTCDGKVVETHSGQVEGTWQSAPGGGFNVTSSKGNVSCTPGAVDSTPTPGEPQ